MFVTPLRPADATALAAFGQSHSPSARTATAETPVPAQESVIRRRRSCQVAGPGSGRQASFKAYIKASF